MRALKKETMQALQTVLPCKMRGRVTLCILSSIEPVRNISPAAPPTLTHAGTSCVPAPQPPHTGRSCCLTDPLLATQTTLRRAPLPYPTTHQATHQAPYVAARGASTHPPAVRTKPKRPAAARPLTRRSGAGRTSRSPLRGLCAEGGGSEGNPPPGSLAARRKPHPSTFRRR